MKIRFDDGGKVKSRSICGTRGTFQSLLEKKQREHAIAAHAKKMLKAAVRKRGSTFGGGGAGGMSSRGGTMSRMSTHRTQSMLKADKSEVSMGSITFAGGIDGVDGVGAGAMQEKVSE